jgi:hypothetical protein
MNRFLPFLVSLAFSIAYAADTVPTDIQQPGTQPGEVGNLESPDKCDNCHGGYNPSVEPAHNWRGSMMSHATRDPIFWATLAIAEQDFDGSGDLCLRCHSTAGWLGGRSTPTDGSGLAAGDADGVECDYCHKLTNPDNSEHFGVMIDPFVASQRGADGTVEGYYGSGMSSLWAGSDKLGPYNDADARHQFMASAFHRDRAFCGTCHDVSNPATGDLAPNNGAQATAGPVIADGTPGAPVAGKAAFNNFPYRYGIVERTFSEYLSGQISQTRVADYPSLPAELRGGALAAIYDAATLGGTTSGDYENPAAPRYFSCQSCHMRPVTGEGANKRGVPVRRDLPLHDMTGGNYWMPEAIRYLDAQGRLRLGGGLSAGQLAALEDGALRAREQLSLAATLSVSGDSVRIVNHTGHKLISGYPEGRRMWLNVRWYDGNGTLVREDGAYGDIDVTLDGQTMRVRSLVDLQDPASKVYEAHMGMTSDWAATLLGLGYPSGMPLSYDRITAAVDCTLGALASGTGCGSTGSYETFHFVLNNAVIKDNRIPPYGMSYDLALVRNALPEPANQYGGGTVGSTYEYFDDIPLAPPSAAVSAEIRLMYQPTSWEYVQFLYLANNGTDPAEEGNAFLGAEGANLLDAWLNTGMAEPYVMATASWGTAAPPCTAEVPAIDTAVAGDKSVAVSWTAVGDPELAGYRLYYDQGGKAQRVVDLACTAGDQSSCTSYTDTELTNGQEYCYKVTSYKADCESGFSGILCATPAQPGQQPDPTTVALVSDPLVTGLLVTEGKGKNTTTTFVATTSFSVGDDVTIRGTVVDESGTPIAGATVSITISGPESAEVVTSASNADGLAEAVWSTKSPNPKGSGGTATGTYTATVVGVTASGYVWDGSPAGATFTIAP